MVYPYTLIYFRPNTGIYSRAGNHGYFIGFIMMT